MAGFFRRFTKRFFVLCNIGAALLFLLGCYAYLFDPKYFWFFGLLALGFFVYFAYAERQQPRAAPARPDQPDHNARV